jgi:CheY-like chemotaxis protein
VLIVDDAPGFRRVARELLEQRGYIVAGEADCAAAALEAAERLAPDAVLLDVRLPDGHGFEVAARLTRAESPPAVLLVSVDPHDGRDELVEASGARGFVSKAQLVRAELTRFWPSAY